MSTLYDFHSHILPNVDDGSASVEESIEMLKRAAEQGIKRVIATPHFYAHHDSPERFLARRERAEKALREAMAEYSDLPELLVGAEVYFFNGMSESDILDRLTIAQKGCILIEMPSSPWSERMYHELEAIWKRRRLIPIVAHIDRYIAPFRTHGILKRLEKLPVTVQANAEFFLNKSTRRMALRMLREDQIHLLGSDCHNLTDRTPNLGEAAECIRQNLGEETLDRIHWYERDVLGER